MTEPRQLDDATVEAIARFLLDYNNEARARLAEAEALLQDVLDHPTLGVHRADPIRTFLAAGDPDE